MAAVGLAFGGDGGTGVDSDRLYWPCWGVDFLHFHVFCRRERGGRHAVWGVGAKERSGDRRCQGIRAFELILFVALSKRRIAATLVEKGVLLVLYQKTLGSAIMARRL